jgi:hypothetical protein
LTESTEQGRPNLPGARLSMPSLSWTKPEAHHLHGVMRDRTLGGGA